MKEKGQKRRVGLIKDTIIGMLGAVGVLSLAVIAPNAVQLLKPFVKNRRKTHISVNTAIRRLLHQRLIYIEETEKGKLVRLTQKGEAYLVAYASKPQKPKRWDGKWRILIFDIKEQRRGTRDQLRRSLVEFGFRYLQRSVWIYPYDCEDLVILLKADFKIGKDVLYIVAEHLENDQQLCKSFNLLKP